MSQVGLQAGVTVGARREGVVGHGKRSMRLRGGRRQEGARRTRHPRGGDCLHTLYRRRTAIAARTGGVRCPARGTAGARALRPGRARGTWAGIRTGSQNVMQNTLITTYFFLLARARVLCGGGITTGWGSFCILPR